MFHSRYRVPGGRTSPIAVVILVVVFVGFKLGSAGSAGRQHLARARAEVARLPSYEANHEYLDRLVTDAHERCFADAHTVREARRGRSRDIVDEAKYWNDLLDDMTRQAKTDRESQILTELGTLRKQVLGDG